MLRGGGACVSQRPQQSLQASQSLVSSQFEQVLITNSQYVFKNAEDTQNNYKELYTSFQVLLSLDFELNSLMKSQNQLNKQIANLEKCLTSILESCLLLKNSQLMFFGIRFAQMLSRTIFWHYCQAKTIKDGMQQTYNTLLNKIETINNTEDSFYKNLIEYEIQVCKMIFTILPNDFQEGLEVIALFTSMNSILMNLLPKTMRETVKGGIVHSIRDATKVQYRKIYKQIFNIDVLKWWVINEYHQNTHSLKEIIMELQELQNQLTKSDYFVQQAWVIAISEIVSYAPIIQEEQLALEQQEIKNLQQIGCLVKLKDDYKVQINIPKQKDPTCFALQEKFPALTLLKQIQQTIITKERFFNQLYDNKEETKEQIKQETQIQTIFEYLFSLFTDSDFEINVDLIRKVNSQYDEIKENISLIKQISLNKWIRMLESKSFNDSVVFGEFELKQKQIKHLIKQVKSIQSYFLNIEFIFQQWGILEQIVEFDSKQTNLLTIIAESKQHLLDCQQMNRLNQENLKDLQLLNINFDVYFQIINEFIDRQYQQVYAVVLTTQSNEPILSLYKQYKDVQDIIQSCFRKVNDKILQFKEFFSRISERFKQLEYNCIVKFYNVVLKLQHLELPNQQFEFRNQDHQILIFVQNYEKQIIKYQLIELHKEFKEYVTSSQFQDYEQAKIYLKTIQFICKSMENILNQNKKLLHHINNYKISLQIDQTNIYYNDLLNYWNDILQITSELDTQGFDQNVFSVKFDQIYQKYEQIIKQNLLIRWPTNQYLTQYFKLLQQLDTIFQEFKTYKTYDINSDQIAQNRFDSLKLNLKQICQSQIQRIKSTFEQYTQAVDQLQSKLETKTNYSMDELYNQLINMQEALEDTLNLIQSRISSPGSQQNVGALNLIQNHRLQDFENLYNYKFVQETIIIAQYIKFNFNFIERNAIQEALRNDQLDAQDKHVVQSGIYSAPLRIVMTVNLINIWNCCLGEEEYEIISKLILYMRLNETNQIIKKEIKTTFKQEYNFIVGNTFVKQLKNIEENLSLQIQERNQLSFQIKYEPSFEISQQLNEKLTQHTEQIQTIFTNLLEISEEFDIEIVFYNNLMYEFKKADQSTSTLDVSEIKFYQGRQLTDLFLLRMGHVSRTIKTQQVKNCYVQLECQKKNEIRILFSTKENKNGIIDKFLEDSQQEQLLLLQGDAGTGKSMAIKMIEEYVWKRNDAIKIIPIIIKLSELKDPINNAINETLRSLNYKFDQSQIELLQKEVKADKVQILFIFEEYEKLAQDYISMNLFKTNNLNQWKTTNQQNSPRFIIVTRSELFKYSNHLRWIDQIENEYNYQNYWNIRLLPYDNDQRCQFLNKYQELNIRNTVIDYYQMICEFSHQDLLISNFINLWKKIDLNLNEQSIDNILLPQTQINKIINALRNDQKVKQIDEFVLKQLQSQLELLKSSYYYQRMLETLNFQQSIDNPQILQIFISALPKLLQNLSDINRVKKDFYDIFLNENYAINCDTKLARIQLERDWNLLANSQFFKNYKADESITKTQILLAQTFIDDPQNQNKYLKAFEKMTITHFDLYEQYIDNFFEIARLRFYQKEKSIDLDVFHKEQWNFSQNLAQKLSYHEIFSVHFNSQGSLIKVGGSVTDWEEFFSDDDYPIKNVRIPKQTIRDSIPLREQFSIFSFENKIIQEFLVARAIILQLENFSSQSNQDLLAQSILSIKNISNPFFQGSVNFIVQKSKQLFSIKQSLLKIILLSRQNEQFSLLSSNAFFLLQNIEPVLKGIDFSEMMIKDIHLEQCQLNNCNLENSQWNNVSANSLVLISNNMQNMKCQNLKLNSYAQKLTNQKPLFLRQFKSGNIFVVFQFCIQTLQGNQILTGNFEDCQIDQLDNTFYLKTKQKLYKIKELNNQIQTEQYDIPNVLSISQFDQVIMLFQLQSKTEAKILELNSKTSEIKFEIPIQQQDVEHFNIKQFYQMKGNQIIFLTNQKEVQSMNYQIEGEQLTFDNLNTHAKLENDDQITKIQYFNTLDITVISFKNKVNQKCFDMIFGTINQLVGRFIWMENKRQEFLFLNGQKIQLINQETFKMINECELINLKSDLLHGLSYQTDNTSFLSFMDGILILSFHPFEVIKHIQINPIDILLNQQLSLFYILTEKEIFFYDFKYLEDRQNVITNQTLQFEDISFVTQSSDFLAKLKNSNQIVFAQHNKKDMKFQTLTNSKNPNIFLSNDESTSVVSDNNMTVFFDMKNNKQTQIVSLQFDKILWIKDHQNFYYMNQGQIEEFRNSVISTKNKIINKQAYRAIKSVQSTNKQLYITTSNSETIVLNEKYTLQEVTMKQMIKKYKDYYITDKDLRLENSKKNTITIIYKSQIKVKDFWIFEDTILIREQDVNNEVSKLVLLNKQDSSISTEIYAYVDQIAYTKNSIQIISNKITWSTYSASDLILMQQIQLPVQTLFISSNFQDQLAIISQFSDITIWNTQKYQISFQQKNVELIQFFKMVPYQENSFYVADRDILKFYIENSIKFSIQLSKKRVQLLITNHYNFHQVYQIEEDKVTLNCMGESNKILNFKKVIFELDCQRETIDCFDNRDHRLIFFGESKIQQAYLDAFDEIKYLEIPNTFKGIEIKYNKDCSMVYIRSTDKIVIVEAASLNVLKQVVFKEILPKHITTLNQLKIFTQGINNILIQLENQNNYFIFNYSISCEKLDLITISKYAQFIGTNSNGLVIVDGQTGVVELYQQKIMDQQINFASFQKVQQLNKSNLVRCEVFDNCLDQCSITSEKGISISDLWRENKQDDVLLMFE